MARTILPFGPQHPVLPEPLHLKLTIEDEIVVEALPTLGYVHRGLEKLCEVRDFNQMIQIVERVSASQSTDSKVGRANELSTGITSLPLLRGGAEKTVADALTLGAESKNDFKGSGATSSNNTFTGSIATTVVDVLPNGHLVIAGEKQIGVNHNVDVLRFTGTVDPRSLRPGSTVASTQVANLRVESRSRGQAGEAQSIGWLSRFFLNVMPF